MMAFTGYFTTLLTSLVLLLTSELSDVQAISTKQFNNFKKTIKAKCSAANDNDAAKAQAIAAENRAMLAEARGIITEYEYRETCRGKSPYFVHF